MDHDMSCGNPNMTHHVVALGGDWLLGEQLPAADTDYAFMQCAPGGNAASAHLMTAGNTEGYVIAWFSPKQSFANMQKVCVSVSMNYIGNGNWWQMLFLTDAEVAHHPQTDQGQTITQLALGYTSPEFPRDGGPSTIQGTAGAGVKFNVNSESGDLGSARLVIRPWRNGSFGPYGSQFPSVPASTADKAPRYPVCVEDLENGTLRISGQTPQGAFTQTLVGEIPNNATRVVFEQDMYNPDKHYSNAFGVGSNEAPGYTIHWDDVTVQQH
jgi:hypothetical protein